MRRGGCTQAPAAARSCALHRTVAAQVFAETRGRPLGMELAADGTLYVADSVRGLLAVSADAEVRVLATEAGGVRIGFADDVGIGPDGTVYFSDATTKFRPPDHGGDMEASLLELIEHRGNGRLLAHDPRTGKTRVLLRGLVFANGVALAHDGRSVLVNETGNYRTLRYWLAGEKAGRAEPFLENLPGFPDNIGRGIDGRYWEESLGMRSSTEAKEHLVAQRAGQLEGQHFVAEALHLFEYQHPHYFAALY
jgi:sugar lactone lactonase YvrE